MIIIFKHDNQNFILNSDDIVNISNVLTSDTHMYFNIILKTNYTHVFYFQLPTYRPETVYKQNFVLDEFQDIVKAK